MALYFLGYAFVQGRLRAGASCYEKKVLIPP